MECILTRSRQYAHGYEVADHELKNGHHAQILHSDHMNFSNAFVSGYNKRMKERLGINTQAQFIAGWDSVEGFPNRTDNF
jgi:hypothetical protein